MEQIPLATLQANQQEEEKQQQAAETPTLHQVSVINEENVAKKDEDNEANEANKEIKL